jgi:uncharacterized protein involved in exopolysaccharide biosynthesis
LDTTSESTHDDFSVHIDFIDVIVRKFILMVIIVVIGMAAVIYYMMTTDRIYRSEIKIAPVSENEASSSLGGLLGSARQFSGLSGLGQDKSVNYQAILRSRELAERFIQQENLMPVLFKHLWDAQNRRWNTDNPANAPTMWDAVNYFNADVKRIVEDGRTGIITISMDWTDGELAKRWAEGFVELVNRDIQEAALRDADENIAFLQEAFANTQIAGVRTAISNLLAKQIEIQMLAVGKQDFAFEVIDEARTPPANRYVKPNKLFLLIVGLFGFGTLAIFLSFGIEYVSALFRIRALTKKNRV